MTVGELTKKCMEIQTFEIKDMDNPDDCVFKGREEQMPKDLKSWEVVLICGANHYGISLWVRKNF